MKKIMTGALAAALLASGVQAADLYQPPVIEAPPTYIPEVEVQEASGWYLRGDAAFVYNKSAGVDFYQGSNKLYSKFASAKMRNSFALGVGAGYQVNSYLRVDATADYTFKSKFSGSTTGSCGANSAASGCVSTDLASMTAFSLMANAYVDLGTYGMVTPYVGAGVGGTYVKWSDLKNTACDVTNSSNCDATVTHTGHGSWRFTYALMAGASIKINCQLKADIGYRYRNVAGGKMFGYSTGGGPGYDRGFHIHEGRAGLRYSFGDDCAAPVYTPPVYNPPAVYK
ncbi:outer membrane protein [Rhizobium sp. L1K21]|uniref:outer membrane protein n=1 Tax=Rhizobium sp. L1K21 TaxID=2954933 RepID=UPI002092F5F8|nr:outer membrane protein [Rhizobium sp. L1K21]MCO6185111.1 porin family protein [Rhizobium sp. L1K21]